MLTHKLASALDTIMRDLEISPVTQDTWALPKNRDALIRIMRKLAIDAHKIESENSERGRGYPRAPQPAITGRRKNIYDAS